MSVDFNWLNTSWLCQHTSSQFFVKHRIESALVIGVEYVGLIAAAGATLHCRVEAPRPVELGGEAPRTERGAYTVAADRLAGAGVLGEELLRPLCPARRQQACPHKHYTRSLLKHFVFVSFIYSDSIYL